MKKKYRFWCNAGHTSEEVELEIDIDSEISEEQQILDEFHKWLDNNENVGFEEIS